MRMRVLLAAAAVAVSLPVAAFSDSAPPASPAQAAGSDPDQIVCKTTPPVTGSRLGGGRECHTQREWDDREKASQRDLMDKQMHGLQSCIGSCGG